MKSFFVGLLICFVVYEIVSITLGVIKNKKNKNTNESEGCENEIHSNDNK